MNRQFNAPIPGQSLTKTPNNYPWERPPEISNVDEAVIRHIENISEPKAIDNLSL